MRERGAGGRAAGRTGLAERLRSVLLFGAPGVGKGTQGRILGCAPGFAHIAMGDLFRALDPGSRLGRTVRRYSSKGELVPDEITIELLTQSVDDMIAAGRIDPARDILVLDGAPRNLAQAALLDGRIDALLVLHLDTADDDAMIERLRKRALKEGRADDAKEDVIRRRWEVYRRETAPVLAHYPADRVVRIEALGSPMAVLARIAGRLATLPLNNP